MGGKSCKPVVSFVEARKTMRERQMIEMNMRFCEISTEPDRSLQGSVSQHHFLSYLSKILHPVSLPILKRLFQVADFNGDGRIDHSEFVCFDYIVYHGRREDKLRFLFNLFDTDGTGRINAKTFKAMAITLTQGTSPSYPSLSDSRVVTPLADLLSQCAFAAFDRYGEKSLDIYQWCRYAEEEESLSGPTGLISRLKPPERRLLYIPSHELLFPPTQQQVNKEKKRPSTTNNNSNGAGVGL